MVTQEAEPQREMFSVEGTVGTMLWLLPPHIGNDTRVRNVSSGTNFPLHQLSSILVLWSKLGRRAKPKKAYREQGE